MAPTAPLPARPEDEPEPAHSPADELLRIKHRLAKEIQGTAAL